MIRATEAPPGIAAELGALIGVNHCAARSATTDRQENCIEHQFALDTLTCRPADDLAREQTMTTAG